MKIKIGCGKETDKLSGRLTSDLNNDYYKCGENPHPLHTFCSECQAKKEVLEDTIKEIDSVLYQLTETTDSELQFGKAIRLLTFWKQDLSASITSHKEDYPK